LRKVILALAALTIGAWCACAWAQPKPDLTGPITVEQALKIAFDNNPDIKISADQVARGKGVVSEARARFMPRFNVGVTHIRQGPAISLPTRPRKRVSASFAIRTRLPISRGPFPSTFPTGWGLRRTWRSIF